MSLLSVAEHVFCGMRQYLVPLFRNDLGSNSVPGQPMGMFFPAPCGCGAEWLPVLQQDSAPGLTRVLPHSV